MLACQGGNGRDNENDALFSDDDSGGESTHPEDEESDAGAETDEQGRVVCCNLYRAIRPVGRNVL